ncbi:MAG TPA: hypothetical protein VE155_06580 [Pseudonocardiaceae bacterium]|nr:hypothetical protein [Pseudonocardiaceae bacterium]
MIVDIIAWTFVLIINIRYFVRLLRKGPGNLRDARTGRNLTLVVTALSAACTAYYFSAHQWVPGAISVVLMVMYCVTVFIANRYIDREENKLDRTDDLDW